MSTYDWKFNYCLLMGSFATLLAYCVLIIMPWKLILERLGRRKLPFRKGYKFWFLSQMGKYLPGKFWYLLGRAYFCEREGFEKSVTVASMILEMILVVVSGGFVFFLSLFVENTGNEVALPYLLVIPIGLACIHPFFFSKGINFIVKRLKGMKIQFDFNYLQMLSFVGTYMILWFFCGLAFFLFVNSIYRVSWSKFLSITGTFSIAWVMGFLSFITPCGLGVREGILSALLATYIPVPSNIVITLLSRIWFIAAEFVCAMIAWRL